VGASIVAPGLALNKLFGVILMSFKDDIQARCGLIDGDPVLDGKPHRFPAYGDKPGHDTGNYAISQNGDGFCASWHAHSVVIWHDSNVISGSGVK